MCPLILLIVVGALAQGLSFNTHVGGVFKVDTQECVLQPQTFFFFETEA